MTDLVDYVLSGSPGLSEHPDFGDLESDLLVGALDFADEVLDVFRRRDRLADVMADERYESWTTGDIDWNEIAQGMRVHIAWLFPGGGREVRLGVVAAVTSPSWPTDPNVLRIKLGGDGRLIKLDARDRDRRPVISRWLPIPVDGAVLRDHPDAWVHQRGPIRRRNAAGGRIVIATCSCGWRSEGSRGQGSSAAAGKDWERHRRHPAQR